jgi:hypothetical protein
VVALAISDGVQVLGGWIAEVAAADGARPLAVSRPRPVASKQHLVEIDMVQEKPEKEVRWARQHVGKPRTAVCAAPGDADR